MNFSQIMDSDLQHDETILHAMLLSMKSGSDLVVGSRYINGGTAGDGFSSSNIRRWGSVVATKLAYKALRINLADPMSGFFMIRRDKFDKLAPNLSLDGFKLLFDIASYAEDFKVIEIPYSFRGRIHGESKLDALVTFEYLGLLVSKLSGGIVSLRFVLFAVTGGSGLIIHLLALSILTSFFALEFLYSQAISTICAMTWNYFVNNQLTFRDRRLKGLPFVKGLVIFYATCSIGAMANIGIASWLFGHDNGAIISGLSGALLGALFNYLIASIFIWKAK